PSAFGTAVVTIASRSANVTLKIDSVDSTKIAVSPSDAISRESRVAMRSKFSSVSWVTASVRSMSVNARTTSTITGATKKHASSTSAGPRNSAKLARCRRTSARAKSGMGRKPGCNASVLDHDVLAELVFELADHEIGRFLRIEAPRLDALDPLEDDRVVLANLRVIRHERRVLEHRRRRDERPPLVDDLR